MHNQERSADHSVSKAVHPGSRVNAIVLRDMPDAFDAASGNSSTGEAADELLGEFPHEVAMLMVVAGAAGVVLPGTVGMPLLIAGGAVLWPKTFRPIEKWFCRKFPAVHRQGVIQLKEFVNDLNRRFPEKRKQ